jgi:four helix bundle protein
MATVKSFEELEVWKKARVFSKSIFSITRYDAFSKDFALKQQILRSSGSIMDNIAEGFERGGTKEFIQFLGYSKGSAGETRSQLYSAKGSNYINEEVFIALKEEALAISRMISAFMNYLINTDKKGIKFKESGEKKTPLKGKSAN